MPPLSGMSWWFCGSCWLLLTHPDKDKVVCSCEVPDRRRLTIDIVGERPA